jgi:hypothetical protein
VGTGDDEELDDDEIAAIEAENARLAELERLRLEEEARIRAEEEAAAAAAAEAERQWQKKLNMLPTRINAAVKRAPTQRSQVDGYDFSEISAGGVNEALADLEDPLAWIVLSVPEAENPGKVVAVDGSGSGDLDETASVFRDDAIQYGVVRVTAIERKGVKLSLRARLVLFTWSGARCSATTRRWNTGVSRVMASYFTGITAELQVPGDRSLFVPQTFVDKLAAYSPQGTVHRFGFYDKAAQVDDYLGQIEDAKGQMEKSVFYSPGKATGAHASQFGTHGGAAAAPVAVEEAPAAEHYEEASAAEEYQQEYQPEEQAEYQQECAPEAEAEVEAAVEGVDQMAVHEEPAEESAAGNEAW